MNQKHTPGPWQATAPDGDYHDVIRIYAEGREDRPIAICPQMHSAAIEVVCGNDNDTTEAAGNARLIAAAPELMEALKVALVVLQLSFGQDDGLEQARVEAVEKAQAAIAEAEKGAV